MKTTANSLQVMKALKKLGFYQVRTKGDHYVFKKGRYLTQVPYHSGNKSVPKGTICLICRQAGVTKKELMECL